VFGAQCLQGRMARDVPGFDGEETAKWKAFLLSLLEGSQTGGLVLCDAARLKCFQAISSFAFNAFPTGGWPSPMDHILHLIQASQPHRNMTPVLELLACVAEETERFAFGAEQRYKWMHELKGAFERVAAALGQIPFTAADVKLAEAKLRCLAAWIKIGMPLGMVTDDINASLQALQVPELFDPVLDLLVEVANLLSLTQSQSLSLLPILTRIHSSFPPDETFRLTVAFAESHNDDIFNGLIAGNDAAHQFLINLIQLSGAEGVYLMDEQVSASTLPAWGLLHDLAVDHGLPAGPLIASLFTELSKVMLRKAELPSDEQRKEMPKEFLGEFQQYRMDLADGLLYCWRVIGIDLIPILLDGLVPDANWRTIEVRLWAFNAIAEELDSPHPLLASLLSSLPLLASHPRNRTHAVRLLGALAHLRVGPGNTVAMLVGEIRSGGDTSVEAARALYSLQDETPDVLAPSLHELLTLMSGVSAMQPQCATLLARTVGSMISETPDPLAALGQAIDAMTAINETDLQTICTLSALLRAVSLKDISPIAPATEGYASLHELVHLVQSALARDNCDESFVSVCTLCESLVLACGEAGFELATPLFQLLAVNRHPSALELSCTALCVYGPTRPDLVDALASSLLTGAFIPEMDEDLAESLLALLSKVTAKCLSGLTRLDLNDVMQWTTGRLGGAAMSTPLLRALLKLHVSFLSHPDETYWHWTEGLYSVHGQHLLHSAFFSACNLMPRSQIESIGRLLFELHHRFPQQARAWLHHSFNIEGFPNPRYSAAEKLALERGMAACRSVGKMKQLLADFCKP